MTNSEKASVLQNKFLMKHYVLGISEFDADIFEDKINKITVPEANHLIYHFKGGHTIEMVWKDRSRSESWTPEKREQARQNSLKRRNQ